jgi:excisionase family DNA binding protein
MNEPSPETFGDAGKGTVLERWLVALRALDEELYLRDGTLDDSRFMDSARMDLFFLAYLRATSSFGVFSYGPVTIHLAPIDAAVERAVQNALPLQDNPLVLIADLFQSECKRSGRRTIDELHMLLAFMRVGVGLPARVFGELGVTPEQVEEFARTGHVPPRHTPMETLYSPEEAAAYLKVHVQTVREWIRSGRLKAFRLAGQRSLRIRASDLDSVLEPVEAEFV